jgi:hypothetical protein
MIVAAVPYWQDRDNFTDYGFNPPRYEIRRLLFIMRRRVELVNYRPDPVNPPKLVLRDGRIVTFFKGAPSDGGSIPFIVQWWTGLTRDRFKPAFYFHDLMYANGGAWISCDGGATWAFVELTRYECDDILDQAIQASDGTTEEREIVFDGLSWFGWAAWEHHREHRKVNAQLREVIL